MELFIFSVIFIVVIGSACVVAFSKNLVHSAFALFGTFAGVAAIFVLLHASFLGLVQLVVYAGGILVLIVFAVMLTSKISSTTNSNPVMNWKAVLPLVLILTLAVIRIVSIKNWGTLPVAADDVTTTSAIGNLLLRDFLLPFELISVVLLMALIGAAIVSRKSLQSRVRSPESAGLKTED